MPTEQAALLREALRAKDYRSAIASLLVYYYDPRYENKQSDYVKEIQYQLDATDLNDTAMQIQSLIEKGQSIR